ncbi:MAG TPA: isoprenylcysteine carboxylmethyltransferase family protein [Candidatus Eisenbacteria bacterium]|nr:isoprenylcysteine carboxylmethyltransferase family protein [Candidatus Eisenbacteria bacterium]
MPTNRPNRALVLLSRWRINIGWLSLLFIPLAKPTIGTTLAWLPLLAAGVALRVWARGHLVRAQRVTDTGPYALVRHPLYLGSLMIALAFAFMTRVPLAPVVITAVFLLMYVPKALREEAYLTKRFGAQYVAYQDRVGAFVPRVLPTGLGDLSFTWERVLGHREWKTWMGIAALLTFMFVRAATMTMH